MEKYVERGKIYSPGVPCYHVEEIDEFLPEATKPEDFIKALVHLQEACSVVELKIPDFGITPDEFEKFMRNTREVMGIMFTTDRA